MLAAALLVAALAIAGWGRLTGRSLPARIAAAFGAHDSRARMIRVWALGTAMTYGASTGLALAMLGRLDAIATMPAELRTVAWRFELGGEADAATLAWFTGCLIVGVTLGAGILALRHRLGRPPVVAYRSPAAARTGDERIPAALLALSAGVSEELFFRLLIPLLFALALGAPLAGFVVSLVAFTALHRHQGRVGMVAVAFVGGWLSYLYLLTGALWVVAVLHTLIDLHALVLRPWWSRTP